ncbi:MAG: type II CAAX endopeptidase family protein [Acidimicrobiales bacterium]
MTKPPVPPPHDGRFGPPSHDGPFGPPPLGPPSFEQAQPTGAVPAMPPPTGAPWGSPPPPPGAFGPPPSRQRPWWGLGDVLLALPVIILTTIVATVVWAIVAAISGTLDLGGLASGDDTELPASLFAASLVGQQLGQGVWPWIVSKWKGRGMRLDWGWAFEWRDLWIGPLTGLAALVLAVVVGALASTLVGGDEVSNTSFLDDAEGTLSYWVLIAGVAIGAPLTEELLFRGLILRALEKRAGSVVAIIGSTIAFTLPHYISASPAELVVLLASIGSVGLVFAIVAVRTRRLAPVIIAHVLFNGLTVVQLLLGS